MDESSHPSRVRGLKLSGIYIWFKAIYVAPFAGAWIEIGIHEGFKGL